MVTETVKVKFEVDNDELVSTQSELVKTGAVAESTAKNYDKLAGSVGKFGTNAAKSTKEFGDAAKTAAAGVNTFNAAAKGATNTNANFAQKTVSLRRELKLAKDELYAVAKATGVSSKETQAAIAKTGALADTIKDLNRQVGLINPEDRIRAFYNFGSGVSSALQVISGAFQTVNAQSEEFDRVISRIYGVVSTLFGLASFAQLSDQFKDIGAVLGFTGSAAKVASSGLDAVSETGSQVIDTAKGIATATGDSAKNIKAVKDVSDIAAKSIKAKAGADVAATAAANTNSAALVTQSTATNAAAVSTRALTTAILTSPLFIIASVIGAVVGAMYLYEKANQNAAKEAQRLLDIEAGLLVAKGEREKAELALAVATNKKTQTEVDRIDLLKKLNDDLLKLYTDSRYIDLVEKAAAEEERVAKKRQWYYNLINNSNVKLTEDQKKAFKKQTDDFITENSKYIKALEQFKKTENEIVKTYNANLGIINEQQRKEEEAKRKEENEKALQQREEYISKLLESLEEEKRVRQDALTLLQTQGVEQSKQIQQQIENNKIETVSLQTILEKARGTRQYASIQSRINALIRDELNLRAQLGKVLFRDELTAIDERARSREDEISLLQQIGTKESDILKYRLEGNIAKVGELNTLLLLTTNASDREEVEKRINDLLKERKGLEIAIPKATESDKQAKLQEDLDALQKDKDAELLNNELKAKSRQELAALNLQTEEKYLEYEIKARESYGLKTVELQKKLSLLRQKINKEDLDSLEQIEEDKLRTVEFTLGSASQLINDFNDLQNELYESDIAAVQDLYDKKLITEEEYDRRLAIIKQKQAEANKRAQVAQAIISAAQGVINALGTQPPNLVPFAVALATALGAANVSKILATPIPKFKKGTLNFGGGNLDADGGALAMLHPNEAVIPADINKAYHPALKAIYNKRISASDINNFVIRKLKNKQDFSNAPIINNIDMKSLAKSLSKQRTVDIANADYIAAAIANELNKSRNIRRS